MEDNNTYQGTVGILYPGEMGTSLGKLLRQAGFCVVTTVEGRSSRTQRLCDEARLTALASLGEVLARSHIVISLVAPRAALSLARDVAAHRERPCRRLLYLDANSISPKTVAQIAEVLRDGSVDFVDGAIFGLASQLQTHGKLYLSGPRATELLGQFGSVIAVKIAGEITGQASALKMIVSGIPKGLSALFMETMLFAQNMHLLDESLGACDEIYPGIMQIMNRMLPTYPLHAVRRCDELQQVEETMLRSGLKPRIVQAVREVTSAVANVDWQNINRDFRQWTIPEMIEQMQREGTLQSPNSQPISAEGQSKPEP
jgi:3-hydroxyisobutyrate dehydrogenase-like beta-hydroxyacid dehydrogenase